MDDTIGGHNRGNNDCHTSACSTGTAFTWSAAAAAAAAAVAQATVMMSPKANMSA